MSARQKRLTVTASVLLVLGIAVAAWAFYAASGFGSGDALATTLASPAPVAASAAGTGAAVTWNAVASPSGDASDVSYTVSWSTDGATWVAATGSCAGTLDSSTTSCTDSPAVSGDYYYRVTATFRTWTSQAQTDSAVLVTVCDTATNLVVMTSSQTLAAGSVSGVITVQRQNASGTSVTCGSTTVDLSTSSGAGSFRDAANTQTITSVTIPSGSSDGSFRYSDTVAGTVTITAADHAAVLTQATQTETVTGGTATVVRVETAADGTGTLVPAQSLASGSSIAIYSISRDTYGNFVANAAADSWSLPTKTGGTANGDLVAATDSKSATFTGHGAGTASIRATSSGLVSVDSGTITVTASTFAKLLVLAPGEVSAPGTSTGKTGTPTAQTAGTAFSVTVQAVDGNWNPVSSTDTVSITSSDTNATLPADAALVAGTKTFSVTLKTAGSSSVTATDSSDGTKTANSSTVPVNAGTFAKLLLLAPGETAAPGTSTGKTGTPTARTAGVAFNVGVQAVDANWNSVSSTDTVSITSSDASATLPPNAALVGGTKTFSVTLKTAGSKTVTASDVTNSAKTANSSTIQVNAAGPATATFSTQPGGAGEGAVWATQPAVTIKDAFNNLVPSSPVTLSISTNPSSGTLSCTANPTNTDSLGVASFAGCSIDKFGTGYKLTATDGSASVISSAFNVTGPQVTKVVINNKSTGGTSGRPEAGDNIAITYSAGLKMTSVCSTSTLGNTTAGSITPAAASTTVTLKKNSGNTAVTFASSDCTLNIGSLSLSEFYVSGANGATVTFAGSTVTWNGANVITVTLGSTVGGSGSLITDTNSSSNTFTPSTSATDPAGNIVTSTVFSWTAANF